jgi:hypothetical protein
MARRRRSNGNPARGDAGVIVIGSLLAAAAALFAARMLYSGPGAPGQDFRLIELAANRETAATAALPGESDADPITTGSLPDERVISSPGDVPDWFGQPGRPVRYRLRGVVSGNALVDISSGASYFIYRVERGGVLPGLGRVDDIRYRNGGWQIITPRARTSSAGTVLMREEDAEQRAEAGK